MSMSYGAGYAYTVMSLNPVESIRILKLYAAHINAITITPPYSHLSITYDGEITITNSLLILTCNQSGIQSILHQYTLWQDIPSYFSISAYLHWLSANYSTASALSSHYSYHKSSSPSSSRTTVELEVQTHRRINISSLIYN